MSSVSSASSPIMGRVVATEKKPNTAHEFHFWTSLDSPVGIGTIVRVDGEHPVNGQLPRVYGIVVEGFSYTDLQSPIHDVLGHDGAPETAAQSATLRAEIRLYTAHVLRQIPDEPLQPRIFRLARRIDILHHVTKPHPRPPLAIEQRQLGPMGIGLERGKIRSRGLHTGQTTRAMLLRK